MFFKALVAMVTADAFDRRMRDRQHKAWVAAEERRAAAANSAHDDGNQQLGSAGVDARRLDLHAPERPVLRAALARARDSSCTPPAQRWPT